MILFPCEHCGKVICVDEQSASQQTPCPYCQRQITIPSESSLDCHLVYHDPGQPNGMPMSSAELQEQLEAGNLFPSDLIWTKQAWRPLYQILNIPLGVGAPQTEQPELAIHFDDLAPLSGFAPLPKRGKRRKSVANQKASSPTSQTASEHVSLGQRIKKVLFAIAALAVLFFGIVRGLRIYNYATKQFASVMVYNSTSRNCAIQFPFSGFEPILVYKDSFGIQENLVVGIPCHKALKVWFSDEAYPDFEQIQSAKPDQTISVSIRPNHDTLVNLNNTPFPAYRDFDELQNSDLMAPEQLLSAMARQIAENAVPKQAQVLFEQAQSHLKEHLVKMVAEPVVTDLDYDLTHLNILSGERAERPPRPDDAPRPCLFKPDSNSLSHPNGKFTIKGEAELEQLSVKLSPTTYQPPIRGVSFNAPAEATLAPLENGGLSVDVIFHHLPQKTLNPENFVGIWKYHAELSPEGIWNWQWLCTPPEQKTRVIAPNGTVTIMEN